MSDAAEKARRAKYASRLEADLKAGKALSPEDAEWLNRYKSMTKRGRPRAPAPTLPIQEENGAPEEIPPPPPSGAPKVPPPINLESEDDAATSGGDGSPKGGQASHSDGNGDAGKASQGERSSQSGGSGPEQASGKKSPPPTEEDLKKYAELTGLYCGWLKKKHAEFDQVGAPALSPKVIDLFIAPATYVSLIQFHDYVGIIMKYLNPVIAAGPGVYTMVMERRIRMFYRAQQQRQRENVVDAKPSEEKKAPENPRTPTEAPQHPKQPTETSLAYVPPTLRV